MCKTWEASKHYKHRLEKRVNVSGSHTLQPVRSSWDVTAVSILAPPQAPVVKYEWPLSMSKLRAVYKVVNPNPDASFPPSVDSLVQFDTFVFFFFFLTYLIPDYSHHFISARGDKEKCVESLLTQMHKCSQWIELSLLVASQIATLATLVSLDWQSHRKT